MNGFASPRWVGRRALAELRCNVTRPLLRIALVSGQSLEQVPGRAEIIDVYDCLDAYPAQHRQALFAGLGAFQAAMAAYQAGKWSVAEAGFETCRQYWAEDLVVHDALARVRERAATNEPWDGVERPGKG